MTRPHLLYLVHRFPYPPDKGDRIRAFHLLRHLARRHTMHLAALADEPVDDGAVTALKHYCEQVAVVPLGPTRWLYGLGALLRGRSITEGVFQTPALRSLLEQWSRAVRFDACVVSASSMVPYLRAPGLQALP